MDYRDFSHIPENTYDVVTADPPWMYYGSGTKDAAAAKHYQLMSDDWLRDLPVKSRCKKNAICLVWATCPRLDAGVDLIRSWGFHFRGVAFVWVKTRQDGTIIHGQGVRPTVVKPTTEMVLVGSTSKTGRSVQILDEGMGQVVLAPRGEHSAKPPEVRARVERLFGPSVKRLELFARGPEVAGWDRFGNEI